jgi:ATP-dependent Zn protease
LVLSAYQRAKDLLAGHRAELQALAQTLLAKETLDAPEIDKILASFQEPATAKEPQDSTVDLSLSLQQA